MFQYPLDINGEDCFIGIAKIPLDVVLCFLDQNRYFTIRMAVQYMQDVYNIGIGELLHVPTLYWRTKRDYYHCYENNMGAEILDSSSRGVFNNRVRNHYLKFLDIIGWGQEYDSFSPNTQKGTDIHHIYPLDQGGCNRFQNLILLSSVNHRILERNPFYANEKVCKQAVDYLFYLYQNIGQLMTKYKLDETSISALTYVLEKEMDFFYSLVDKK